jgi:hypothetical protein
LREPLPHGNTNAELRIKADLEHVRDPVQIGAFGVMAMPALLINGQVKAAGRLPSRGVLKEWLLETSKRT